MVKKYIVAEVTKNWTSKSNDSNIISQKFEEVIQVNLERGYVLQDWKFTTVVFPQTQAITETIIAVFVKIDCKL